MALDYNIDFDGMSVQAPDEWESFTSDQRSRWMEHKGKWYSIALRCGQWTKEEQDFLFKEFTP